MDNDLIETTELVIETNCDILIPLSLLGHLGIEVGEDEYTVDVNGDTYKEVGIDLLIAALGIPDNIETTVDHLFI